MSNASWFARVASLLHACSRNVFLKNGQAKVGDFGLSKRIETTSEDQAAVLDGKADDGKICRRPSPKMSASGGHLIVLHLRRHVLDACDGSVHPGAERVHPGVHRVDVTMCLLAALSPSVSPCTAVGRQRSVREGMLEKATDPAVLPIRWTSPEALLYRDWSQKSDVWSFGVLMYECYTAGATPFLGMQNADVRMAPSFFLLFFPTDASISLRPPPEGHACCPPRVNTSPQPE